MATILGLDVVLHGWLLTGELPPDLSRRLIRRLTDHGSLPEGASEADLSLLLHDLAQRLHWAMGHGDAYPADTPHQTTYYIDLRSDSASESCRAELAELGSGRVVTFVPGDPDRPMTHDEHIAAGLEWQLAVTFPEVEPSPSFEARVEALSALAERHGGLFAGSSIG